MVEQETRLVHWLPIESAPCDRWIWVYCPPYEGLSALQCVCIWHPHAGFCVCELRSPTHYVLLDDLPAPDAAQEARRVVGGEELVEIAAKALYTLSLRQDHLQPCSDLDRRWEHAKKCYAEDPTLYMRPARAFEAAGAVIAAIAPSIASAERERCARIADAIANTVVQPGRDDEWDHGWQDGVKACAGEVAAAIRARAQES